MYKGKLRSLLIETVIIADYVADRVIQDTRRFKNETGADDNQKGLFSFVDEVGERSYLAG